MNSPRTELPLGDILIVDDTPDNLRLLSTMLTAQGYEVRKAINGTMALEVVQAAPPDLILLDINMPDMNGYEVCSTLKADAQTREIPVIFISALHKVSEKVKAFDVGGVDYITKPFQPEEVLARVQNQLSLRWLSKQLSEQNTWLQQEIRDRIRAEDARRLSEEKFAVAFRASPDPITITTLAEGRFIEVNDSYLKLTGYHLEEVIGRTVFELQRWLNPDDRTRMLQIVHEQGVVRDLECDFPTKSGEVRTALLSVEIINLDGQKCLLSVLHDISDRKRAEEALKQAEEKYRSIFENAVEGIFQSTLDGRYLSVNPALARMYGYSSPQELTTHLTDIEKQLYVKPSRRAQFIAAIKQCDYNGNAVCNFVSQVYRKDGSKIWVSENARAVKDAQGKLLYYEGTVEDITLRKEAEAALRAEQEWSESLLLNILPEAIVKQLRQYEGSLAEQFNEATILFADIVGFTPLSAQMRPIELLVLLNKIFSAFDQLTERYGLEKIKTIGDAYMVAGGLPVTRPDHAEAIAQMALDMQASIAQFQTDTGKPFQIRIGINTGPVVAGVIGIKKFSYDLWGDTVNVASRMECQGEPGKIQVTAATYECLKDTFLFEQRGTIAVKGKGEMLTYWLTGRKLGKP